MAMASLCPDGNLSRPHSGQQLAPADRAVLAGFLGVNLTWGGGLSHGSWGQVPKPKPYGAVAPGGVKGLPSGSPSATTLTRSPLSPQQTDGI